MKQIRAIYGIGGCGRGIMPVARTLFDPESLVFVDDGATGSEVNGHPVLSFDELIRRSDSNIQVVVAVADKMVRRQLVQKCRGANLEFFSVVAIGSIVMDNVSIGEGALLSPFVTITSNVKIGVHFQANLYSYVEHDCIIGDYVTLAPGAKINGNVILRDNVYVGSGAVVKNGLPDRPLIIGESAVIGMGAVVTKDVPAGVTVVGNPAKPLIKK